MNEQQNELDAKEFPPDQDPLVGQISLEDLLAELRLG